jgi:hypothetical protein
MPISHFVKTGDRKGEKEDSELDREAKARKRYFRGILQKTL